jgi:hypothetical protein
LNQNGAKSLKDLTIRNHQGLSAQGGTRDAIIAIKQAILQRSADHDGKQLFFVINRLGGQEVEVGIGETDIAEMIGGDLEVHDVIEGRGLGHKTDVDLKDVTTEIDEITDALMIKSNVERAGEINVEMIHMKNAGTIVAVLNVLIIKPDMKPKQITLLMGIDATESFELSY